MVHCGTTFPDHIHSDNSDAQDPLYRAGDSGVRPGLHLGPIRWPVLRVLWVPQVNQSPILTSRLAEVKKVYGRSNSAKGRRSLAVHFPFIFIISIIPPIEWVTHSVKPALVPGRNLTASGSSGSVEPGAEKALFSGFVKNMNTLLADSCMYLPISACKLQVFNSMSYV